jgi:prepilin peptidase CpaA
VAAWGGFLKELFQHTGDLVFNAQERGEAVLSNPRRRKIPYAPAIAIGTLISFFAR